MRISVGRLLKSLDPNFSCVPPHEAAKCSDVDRLVSFLHEQKRLLVLTGAGISTESGLPDYRSEEVGLYSRNKYRKKPYVPIRYQQFVNDSASRKRFWIQNYLGWPRMSKFQPNAAHLTLKKMENLNKIIALVTQNVDSLHLKAESSNVIELHGSAYRVKCSNINNCQYSITRENFQQILTSANPSLEINAPTLNPDGVVELENDEIDFNVPDCPNCKALLKPDIVFFGENIPKSRVDRVNGLIGECDSLLVLGSTLTVHSSYRIVLSCDAMKKPIVIVNIGPTRGDRFALHKIEARCGALLPLVFDNLCENK